MNQILVHVSAPSSASDDARYLAQVAAIRTMMQEAQEANVPPASQSASASATIQTRPGDPNSRGDSDSLDSIISVIPDSQPEPEPGREPRRRRTEICSPSVPAQRLSPKQQNRNTTLSLPVELRPPPPPISTAPFTTHVTPTLSMLVERLNPARTYRPVRQTRDLDKLERGYWAVQICIHPDPLGADATGTNRARSWNRELFARFWRFLVEFIGEARAGWGVWCFLDHAPEDESEGVLLKVYAWGEVAMHVYLLLFLASERRIRGLEAKWMDSKEEVVIQMP